MSELARRNPNMSVAETAEQLHLGVAPAEARQEDVAKSALDELFTLTNAYRTGKQYHALMTFIGQFRFYAPFNAMLVHVQMPGATFVAPPHRWLHDYGRRTKPGVRPLVILQPMGPVMFVFDVSDTEALPDALPLPPEVERPFQVRGRVGSELEQTVQNAKRDGLLVASRDAGSQSAGEIRHAELDGRTLEVLVRERPQKLIYVQRRYEVLLNGKHTREEQYATLAHELAHLYCGHLGTPDERWWPDRRGLTHEIVECEAESVAYLVCKRFGIDSPAEQYLANFIERRPEMPQISLACVLTSAGLIEQMGRKRLPPRKPGKK